MQNTANSKITIVCGHYGSGKTNVAVNLALQYKNMHSDVDVALADIDIVNPYFRAADARDELTAAGVRPIIPEFANSNVDIPSLPPELYSLFRKDTNTVSFLDVGGDDGAVVLGMYADQIREIGYEMLYVVSCYRPLTEDPAEAANLMHVIEDASHLKCTGIVNNSSIGSDTKEEDVRASISYAHACAAACNIPLYFTSYYDSLLPELHIPGETLFPMKNVTKQMF